MKNELITAAWIDGRRVEWTTLRQRKGVVEVVESQSQDIPPPEGAEANAPLTAAELHQISGLRKGQITITLPTLRLLLRVVDLPSNDPDELTDMVDLQVDKFSPFPVEHMAVAHECVGGSATSSRVLIAAAKRDAVEELATRFKDAGLPPQRMDVAALGWWHLIQDHKGIPEKGRHALLLLDASGTELIITHDGVPVVVRSLDAQHHASDEEYAAEIAEEIGYTLTSLEAEWGAHAMPSLTVWHHGAAPDILIQQIDQTADWQVQARSLDELPALTEGIARRSMASAQSAVLDLLPDAWHDTERELRRKKAVITAAVSVLTLWILAMGALFLLSYIGRSHIEQLTANVQATEKPAEEVRALRTRVEDLEQYADRTYSALECLREITMLLPPGVELQSFTYRKGRAVNLRGESRNVNAIYDFFEAMEESPLFVDVKPEGVTETPGGRRRPEFRLTAQLPGDES